MRRVMLLALLALALPTASLAGTIGFKWDTGASCNCTTLTGTVGGTSANPIYTLTGPNGLTFTLDFTDVDCSMAGGCTFTGGSAEVTRGTTVLLNDTLTGMGRIIRSQTGNTISDLFNVVDLMPNTALGTTAFGTINGSVKWSLVTGAVSSGRVSAIGATNVPEPGTLGLLGTGLIGLAGMARRKLKLWT